MNKLRYFGMSMILIFIIMIVIVNGVFLIKPYGRINEINPTFEWISPYNENRLLVDDDENFENPIVDVNIKGNKYTLNEKLEFGRYYWKVISGNKMSTTGNFVLDSLIDIDIEENKIKNEGNTDVVVDTITGRHILEIERERELEEGENKVSQV